MPASSNRSAVPLVASSSKPIRSSRRARSATCSFERLVTLMKTLPLVGSTVPAANWLLAKAMGKCSLTPITSPVDFISGPSTMSMPANLAKGKTASLTEYCWGTGSSK